MNIVIRKSHQRHFLRRLRRFGMHANISLTFNRSTNESLLMGCIRVWYESCSANNQKSLQRLMEVAENITGNSLPAIKDFYLQQLLQGPKYYDWSQPSTTPAISFLRQMAQGFGCTDREIIEQFLVKPSAYPNATPDTWLLLAAVIPSPSPCFLLLMYLLYVIYYLLFISFFILVDPVLIETWQKKPES